MRIDRFDLLSYGLFHDVSLDFTAPIAGLTVVVGPNEAGKSTALRALGSMLYGLNFRRSRPGDRMELRAFGLGLAFAEPVGGPIALGALSHIGLGLFVPEA